MWPGGASAVWVVGFQPADHAVNDPVQACMGCGSLHKGSTITVASIYQFVTCCLPMGTSRSVMTCARRQIMKRKESFGAPLYGE